MLLNTVPRHWQSNQPLENIMSEREDCYAATQKGPRCRKKADRTRHGHGGKFTRCYLHANGVKHIDAPDEDEGDDASSWEPSDSEDSENAP